MTKRAAIAGWIYERFGRFALASDVECLESIEVPLGVLLAHLQRGYERGARSVGWFLSPAGLADLHELESNWRHADAHSRRPEGDAGWLRDLVSRYSRDT